jgi:hypothetical protein
VRALLAVWLCVSSAACGNGLPGGTPAAALPEARKADAAAAPAPAAVATVVALPDGKPPAAVRVSLARTEEQRRRGLMYVQNLPPDDGMLFVFEAEAEQSFWMKNTLIPLDMIFIRADLTVAGVVAEAKPLTLDPRGVDRPSRYVLEVNGGWAAQHAVTAGTKVRFDNLPL